MSESAITRIDPTRPHSARVWGYLLGGKDHYDADREAGDAILATFPDFAKLVRHQRDFLARSVHWLVTEAGIRQFLDIGTGLPTADNTHEVAQRVAPESRIVYVDHDAIVLSHARALLTSTPEGKTDYIDADVRDPATVLAGASSTLDFSQPIGLMMLGILGQIPSFDQAHEVFDQYVAALPSGSYIAICDGTDTKPALARAVENYNKTAAYPYTSRSPAAIATFFDGLELIWPGVVAPTRWRPRAGAQGDPLLPLPRVVNSACGVARKP